MEFAQPWFVYVIYTLILVGSIGVICNIYRSATGGRPAVEPLWCTMDAVLGAMLVLFYIYLLEFVV